MLDISVRNNTTSICNQFIEISLLDKMSKMAQPHIYRVVEKILIVFKPTLNEVFFIF